jgi:hypothetical protein
MPNHLLRRHFIGGSDDRTIMGDDGGALLRLWREKRGKLVPPDLSSNLLVQLGLAAKDLNRCWYQANGGQALTEIERHIRHPALRWMAGTVDATGAVFEATFMLPSSLSRKPLPRSTWLSCSITCGSCSPDPDRLFLPWTPPFSKPKALSASVFVDEFDPGLLQSGPDCFDCSLGNQSPFFLEVDDRRQSFAGRVRKLRLRDSQ